MTPPKGRATRANWRWMLATVGVCALAASGSAHTFERTKAAFRVHADGSFEARLTMDLDALALGVDPSIEPVEAARALLALPPADFAAAEEQLRGTLGRRLRVRVDGKPVPWELDFPDRAAPGASPEVRGPLGIFGLDARLRGAIPARGRSVVLFSSRGLPPVELSFSDARTGREEFHFCPQGEECPALPLTPGEATSSLAAFVRIGFEHIVPKGVDHILFVLALFLGGRAFRPLLVQTLVFTLAHSVTLALSTFGVVSLPSSIVEPLIALSIGAASIQNLRSTATGVSGPSGPSPVPPLRIAMIFFFGLLHGLGFAGVLAETAIPEGQRLPALLLFNVGVELGQIAVIASALAATIGLRDPDRYARFVERPASALLALVGLAWFILRIAG